jgi:hypothetical protein
MENNSADIWGKIFKKNKDIVSRKIAGELFIVPVRGRLADMQRIFALNQVAEYIWQTLDGRTTLDDIRIHILSHYDVEKEKAESDILGFIDELIAADLIME